MAKKANTGEYAKKIVQLVKDHYSGTDIPYMLSTLGSNLRSAEVEVPEGARLKDIIESQLQENLSIVQDPDVPARIAVVPLDKIENVKKALLGSSRKPLSQGTSVLLKSFPRAMLISFCKELGKGERIFLKTRKPIRYFVGPSAPDDSYVEIKPEQRIPSLDIRSLDNLNEAQLSDLAGKINGWVQANDIDLESLRISGRPMRGDRQESQKNALERLLAAQPDHIRRQMMIPGDIIQLLMRKQ